ncbi:MAG TPA: DNA gyrase inhibitor YacG [Nitrospiria bacterium]|nr:DNA gyrase inhibitor YacG [Nitrospiria bacterium]
MKLRCPICHKKEVVWEQNAYRPFCSERCKLIDLGEWATEGYRLKGDPLPSEAEQKEERADESSGNGKNSESLPDLK